LQYLVGFLVENVYRTTLVDQHHFYYKVLDFHRHHHRIVLVCIHALKIDVSEGYGRDSPSSIGAGYYVYEL